MSDKRASVKNRSPLDAFLKDEDQSNKEARQQVNTSTYRQTELERTGFYVRPDQNKAIDKLLLDLRDKDLRANRSAVVRAAIDLLLRQDLNQAAALVKEQ